MEILFLSIADLAMKLKPSWRTGSDDTFDAAVVVLTALSTATVEQGRLRLRGRSWKSSSCSSDIPIVTGGSVEASLRGVQVWCFLEKQVLLGNKSYLEDEIWENVCISVIPYSRPLI